MLDVLQLRRHWQSSAARATGISKSGKADRGDAQVAFAASSICGSCIWETLEKLRVLSLSLLIYMGMLGSASFQSAKKNS
jgi:hypothetical protein